MAIHRIGPGLRICPCQMETKSEVLTGIDLSPGLIQVEGGKTIRIIVTCLQQRIVYHRSAMISSVTTVRNGLLHSGKVTSCAST
jgi:hypothetical protein